jgi:spore germination cell wall hydrolase CwlJ-like protein
MYAGRILVLPLPLVLILITLTVVACNIVISSNQLTKIITIPVSTPAIAKSVDPAELRCMSENIYFEAGSESLAGKMAVGQVVLNRLKSPNYPKTVCGVVHQKNGNTCMFSWLCEGYKEVKNSYNWQQSQQVAYKLLSRDVDDLTEGSTNFHNANVNPKWNLKPTVKIDGHQFYR